MKNEMFEKINELSWLIHKRHVMKHMRGGVHADNTRGQGRIIALLKIQDNISTKDLAYLLGVRVSSLNETLAKLERNDYITREASGEDGRVYLVRLTEKGRAEERREIKREAEFTALTDEEQKNFCALADKVIAALCAETGMESADVKERLNSWKARKKEQRKFQSFGGNVRGAGHTCDCNCGEKKNKE